MLCFKSHRQAAWGPVGKCTFVPAERQFYKWQNQSRTLETWGRVKRKRHVSESQFEAGVVNWQLPSKKETAAVAARWQEPERRRCSTKVGCLLPG
jgi:hypothetical protein